MDVAVRGNEEVRVTANAIRSIDLSPEAAGLALTSEQRRHIYLIVKESFTNVIRHAEATELHVRVFTTAAVLRLEIQDDGIGVNHSQRSVSPGTGRGLQSLRDRAALLGGSIAITSAEGSRGTRIVLDIPLSTLR